VEFRRYLQHITHDGDIVADVAPRGLDLLVPVCPPWHVREVVAHLAMVYDHKVMNLRLGRQPGEGEWVREEPFGQDTVEWFRNEHAKLLAELEAHDPTEAAWTWWPPDQTVGFWFRRMALETVVHRVDVETQFGPRSAIDEELAVDGIDEILTCMLDGDDEGAAEAPGAGSVNVIAGDSSWSVLLSDATTKVAEGKKPGADAELTGDPADLFLYLWGRAGIDALSVGGDESKVELLRARLVAATQ
jgi:uncharacterized protein (TIGR03083 family)